MTFDETWVISRSKKQLQTSSGDQHDFVLPDRSSRYLHQFASNMLRYIFSMLPLAFSVTCQERDYFKKAGFFWLQPSQTATLPSKFACGSWCSRLDTACAAYEFLDGTCTVVAQAENIIMGAVGSRGTKRLSLVKKGSPMDTGEHKHSYCQLHC